MEKDEELSDEEKNLAKDNLMNFKSGTHEEELKKQQEKEKMRAEILADLRNSFQ